jgi:hypothetical protein
MKKIVSASSSTRSPPLIPAFEAACRDLPRSQACPQPHAITVCDRLQLAAAPRQHQPHNPIMLFYMALGCRSRSSTGETNACAWAMRSAGQ